VLHEKNGQQRYKYFVLGSDKSYFAYKKTKKQQQTNKQTNKNLKKNHPDSAKTVL
jgi:hypothetical protein